MSEVFEMAKQRISSKEAVKNILRFAEESDDEEDDLHEPMDSDIDENDSDSEGKSVIRMW